jgi:hypothetical protein
MHYAYIDEYTPAGAPTYPSQYEGNVHAVDIATGGDRIVLKGRTVEEVGHPIRLVWAVVAYSADGIYVQKQAYASEGLVGLWLINPDTAAIRQLLPETVANYSLGSGAAWAGNQDVYNNTTVYRIDLATGARTQWFKKPNGFVWYLGSDASGRPLVMWQQDPPAVSEVWVLTGPSQGSLIYSGSKDEMPFLPEVTDSHGVWFGPGNMRSSLWLLNLDGKFVRIAEAPVMPLGKCQ